MTYSSMLLRAAAVAAALAAPAAAQSVLFTVSGDNASDTLGQCIDVAGDVDRLARIAAAAGLRGVVASGHEIGTVRQALGPAAWIVVPGIRRSHDAAGDQVRTIAPREAVRAGATHLVVGRAITHAPDPAAAYAEIRACL